MRTLFLFLLTLNTMVLWGQKDYTLGEQLENYANALSQEKIYVKTDKPYYLLGDTIWYRVFALSAKDHSYDIISKIIYVDLRDADGKVVDCQNILWEEGKNHGEFTIDDQLQAGKYSLNAYTATMLNTADEFLFSRQIEVYDVIKEETLPDTSHDYQVYLFPEGGELIDGISSKVAFKAVSDNGLGIDVSGILKEDGLKIGTVKSLHVGHGYFQLTPSSDKSYSLVVDHKGKEKEFKLPKAMKSGAIVNVTNTAKDFFTVDIKSMDVDLTDYTLVGHIRGNLLFEQKLQTTESVSLNISKAELPDGVISITLLDHNNQAVSERLTFNRHIQNEVKASIDVPYQYFNKRQKAELSLALADHDDQALVSDITITVFDEHQFGVAESDSNIENYFLLSSDIKGYVEQPGFYFQDFSSKRLFLLDLLMMTQGWRRFDWEAVKSKTVNFDIIPERGLKLKGYVKEKEKGLQAKITASVLDGDFFNIQAISDIDGRFVVYDMPLEGSKNIFVTAEYLDADKKHERLELQLDSITRHIVTSDNYLRVDKKEIDLLSKMQEVAQLSRLSDSLYQDMLSIELDNINITAERLNKDKVINDKYNILHNNYHNRVIVDKSMGSFLYGNIFDYLRSNVTGVRVIGPPYDPRVRIRGENTIQGSNDALLLLDGSEVSSGTLASINMDQVAIIDILKGAANAGIYGTSTGVVAIYLKDGSEFQNAQAKAKIKPNSKNFRFTGTHIPRKYYLPDYSVNFAGQEKTDYRTSLYWAPEAKTDQNGKYNFSFYTGDIDSKFIVEIEGISEYGQPFVHRQWIEVR